ncbi:MAG: hypothetical protein JNM27_02255 [Leptospirales bacterium]|nr:hypothetical protein [Leptospirales bacterium]
MGTDFRYFASAAKGIESILATEVESLAARFESAEISRIEKGRAGVSFQGNLSAGYLACLWLRTASRVLLVLDQFDASSPEALYRGVQKIAFDQHLDISETFAVDFASSGSAITHTHFGALKTKDAIADQFMRKYKLRPDVDVKNPSVRFNVYVLNNRATFSIDLSGAPLHERGYRQKMSRAPLKENLAAALLFAANFKSTFDAGGTFLDPMCGSGTLVLEAARMACDVAPGIDRSRFGFLKWKQHKRRIWDEVVAQAIACSNVGLERARADQAQFPLVGFDNDPEAVEIARDTAARLGLEGIVHFELRDINEAGPLRESGNGVVLCNPPYGERLGNESDLVSLYRSLGDLYKQKFKGWRGFVFTGSPMLSKEVGLRADRKTIFYNGPIECKLLEYSLY